MKRFEIIDGKCVIPEGTDYIEDYEFTAATTFVKSFSQSPFPA